MDVRDAITRVTGSDAFRAFKEEHADAYLVHAFSMHESGKEHEWQLGYYLPEEEKIVVFKVDPLERLPPDDAFNKGEPIAELRMDEVKLSYADAKDAALSLLAERHPAEMATKVIVILQRLDRQVFNFTLVTQAFNMFTVRIDAATGEVVSAQIRSVLSLRQSDE